ncbi:hypothetical protein RJ640_006510, partial [Escallonia rubra]
DSDECWEECIQEDELMNLLTKKPQPIFYDGSDPSGRMRIAQGVMKTINVNKLTSAGCKVKIWIADWFAQLNNKMRGDLNKIQTVGRYFIEMWKAMRMKLEGGHELNSPAHEYWPLVMDKAWTNKLSKILRCVQIMGRSELDELTAAQIFYPCMHFGFTYDWKQEQFLSPDALALKHADVKVKIKKAYCPPKVIQGNPCLDYIIFIFKVERGPDNGSSSKKVEEDYENMTCISRRKFLWSMYLQRVTNVDEERVLVWWNRNPVPISQRDLEPRSVIRSQYRNDLWVSVLPKPNQIPTVQFLKLRAWRVVIEPKNRVALLIHQKLTKHIPLLNLQSVS